MMTAGRRERLRRVVIAVVIFVIFMHFVAYWTVGRYAGAAPDKPTLVAISGSILLSWFLMISQAMELITRAFYSRADLDLILASPASAEKVFAVRIVTVALSMAMLAMPLAAPFIDVLIALGGWRWIGAYGVIVAMGAAATALAVGMTVALFRAFGPKRTRLIAQVVAAVIGAAFVIGLQVAAILSYGTLSRVSVLQSQALLALMPGTGSIVWWPARAALGDGWALIGVLALSFAFLAAAIAAVAPRFGEYAITAAGVGAAPVSQARRGSDFRPTSPQRALRRKEWALLRRDPWLVSQTLMQMLYLIPPAVLLWRSFADGNGAFQLLVPVLVMASGQLAGGLAWLAISGEDAPDLVATAPIAPRAVVRAKIEAVLSVIAIVFLPAGRGACRRLAVVCAGHQPRHRGLRRRGDLDPVLVPQPGQTQPVPPSPGFLAFRHLRRGFFVDRLGRDRGGGCLQSLAGGRAGASGAPGGDRRLVHEPALKGHA